MFKKMLLLALILMFAMPSANADSAYPLSSFLAWDPEHRVHEYPPSPISKHAYGDEATRHQSSINKCMISN